MRSLRPLLRLDDKVRLESQRLSCIAEPLSRRAAASAWAVAIVAHAVALALPLVNVRGELPAPRSPRPDFPSVWRLHPPRPSEPLPARALPGAANRAVLAAEMTTAVPGPGRYEAEPVPEPAPMLSISLIPSEIETLIPEPDPAVRDDEPALAPRQFDPAEPKLLRSARPTYPAAARAVGASGAVTLEVWIREDGSVSFARVLSCTRPGVGFEESALLAVREWIYDAAPPGTGSRGVSVKTEFRRDEKRP